MADFMLPVGSTVRAIDDTTTADTTYLGYSEIGEAKNSDKWVIKKVTTTDILYTEGAWDDRVTLTYK